MPGFVWGLVLAWAFVFVWCLVWGGGFLALGCCCSISPSLPACSALSRPGPASPVLALARSLTVLLEPHACDSPARGWGEARFHTAMGSAREALACLEVAAALGHIAPVDEALVQRFDRIVGTLHRLAIK